MRVRVFDNGGKTADRYLVELEDNSWFMSRDANMPNGVCMYAGKSENECPERSREIQLGDLPVGTLCQIINILTRED